MNQKHDMESIDPLEEGSGDIGHAWNKGGSGRSRRSPFGFNPEGRSLILAGITFFVLLIFLALFFRACSKDSTKDLSSVKTRLDQLETKVNQLAATEQEMAKLKEQINGLQQSMAKVEDSKRSLEDQMNRRVQEIGQMTREKASSGARTGGVPAAVSKNTAAQTKKHYHEVRSGETLYNIARKYGMSVAELCRLNNLSPAHILHAGQKLMVASPAQR
jgi:TolA-binding protein